MFNLQGSEIIIILLLALVILGPEKLPDAIRKFTQTYGELKKMGNGFQSEFRSAMEEPMKEMRETADAVRQSVDPQRMVEESAMQERLKEQADVIRAAQTDVPVDPEALKHSDPATRSESEMKPVNQVAASMAYVPTAQKNDAPVDADAPMVPLTAAPEGAAAMMPPPVAVLDDESADTR